MIRSNCTQLSNTPAAVIVRGDPGGDGDSGKRRGVNATCCACASSEGQGEEDRAEYTGN